MNRLFFFAVMFFVFAACKKDDTQEPVINEDPASFKEVASITIGGIGAAEISAYCEKTKRLFIVNNSASVNRIEVIDLANPEAPVVISNISLVAYNGAANSVAVHDGRLAVALENSNRQEAGRLIVFNTETYTELRNVPVGAVPDMVTFSPDGRFILTANEGEPNTSYSIDPEGSVSIIDATNNYSVANVNFTSFNGQLSGLRAAGLRSFGPSAGDLGKDAEPEYLTVSADSRTAWVTLQENNAIAKIDLMAKTITNLWPLGFKEYNTDANAIDPSDQDGGFNLSRWNVKGIYQPDAIAVLEQNGIPYLFTANEGDQREYTAYNEIRRVGSSAYILDAIAFPTAAVLKTNAQLGRLNTTTSLGDVDGDGDFDQIYSFGARSFSVWNGTTGSAVFDSNNDLDKRAQTLGIYDDSRSDDKSTEPEGITIGRVGSTDVLFVGLERADAVALYDVTAATSPKFLQILRCGDAPEGLLYVPARKAPTTRSLLIVSSENDGTIKIYMPTKL